MRGFSVRVFMPDGTPDGIRIIEKSNWTGKGIVCPRSVYTKAKTRKEFNNPGVYVLWGPSDSGGLPRIYVGEGESIRNRLDTHFAKKDFWTTAIFFVSKDENLNKVFVKHLESRLLQLANEANRSEIDNTNAPNPPSLSEADHADGEGFLDEMLFCLPVMGLTVFDKPAIPVSGSTSLYLRSKGTDAKGYESTEGFVVLKGSLARSDEVPSMGRPQLDLRATLVTREILVAEEEGFRLAQDYEFTSPSTAAAVMMGRSANGRIEWKNDQGQTLREIQEASTRN